MRNTTKNARDKITTSRGRSDRAGWSGYRKPLFPHVLHQLLSDSSRQTIASWNEEGTAFKVHNQEAFFQHVMPEYFPQQTQYESFIRQLNLWQFRAGTEQGSYKHEFFIRGKIELCSKMVHVRNKGVKRKMPTQPEDCSHDSGVCISEQTQLAASIIASPTPLIDIDPRVIQCNNDQNNFTTTNNNNEGIHHPASIAGNTRNIHMPDERSNPPRCNEWELNQPRPNRQQRKRRCMQNSAALDAADLADGSSSPVAHHHLGKRKSETADAISQQTTMTPQNVMDDERKRNTENHQHNGNGLSFHGGSSGDNDSIRPLTPTNILQHIEPTNVAEVDQVVAENMKAPSIDDHEEDVNGVNRPDKETDPFLTEKLESVVGMEIETMEVAVEDGNEDNDVDATKEQLELEIEAVAAVAGNNIEAIAEQVDIVAAAALPKKETEFRQSQCERWNDRYAELVEFHANFHHCDVEAKENKGLWDWVHRQRHMYRRRQDGKRSSLTDERQQKLQDLGFIWNPLQALWERQFSNLIAYKAKHGHTNVPYPCNENPSLGNWVTAQRRKYRRFKKGEKSPLTMEKINRLNAIGFRWVGRSKPRKAIEETLGIMDASELVGAACNATDSRMVSVEPSYDVPTHASTECHHTNAIEATSPVTVANTTAIVNNHDHVHNTNNNVTSTSSSKDISDDSIADVEAQLDIEGGKEERVDGADSHSGATDRKDAESLQMAESPGDVAVAKDLQYRDLTERGSYKHDFFIRGKEDLCSKMIRLQEKRGVKRKKPSHLENSSRDSGVCISEPTRLAASFIPSPTLLIDFDPRVIQCNDDNITNINNNIEDVHHTASTAGNTTNIHMPDETSDPLQCNEWQLNQPQPNSQQRKRRCMQDSAASDAADLVHASSSFAAHHPSKRKSETADAISQQSTTTMTPHDVIDDERKCNTEYLQHDDNGFSFHGGSISDNDSIRALTQTNIRQLIEPANVADHIHWMASRHAIETSRLVPQCVVGVSTQVQDEPQEEETAVEAVFKYDEHRLHNADDHQGDKTQQLQQQPDEETANKDVVTAITTITNNDVLLGRRRFCRDYEGNRRLKTKIAERFDQYEASTYKQKKQISEEILNDICAQGGRFLKRVQTEEEQQESSAARRRRRRKCQKANIPSLWHEVDFAEAREKIAHGFRDKRAMDAMKDGCVPVTIVEV